MFIDAMNSIRNGKGTHLADPERMSFCIDKTQTNREGVLVLEGTEGRRRDLFGLCRFRHGEVLRVTARFVVETAVERVHFPKRSIQSTR